MATISVFALITLSGCGKSNVQQEAQQTADTLSGDAKGSAAVNPMCKLFTVDQAAAYIGEPVNAGKNAGMGSGCQWTARDGEGDVMVVTVPANYAERPTVAAGFREVPDAGKDGFVVPELGGWAAGAVVGDAFVKVSVAGSKASDANALALLKETIKRRS
ncbi:MAG: hypothetical protein ABIS51_18685 [Sphingomonas sp.]